MIYEWDDGMKIGYTEIDAQHKGLFDFMSGFFSSSGGRMEREEVEKILDYLEAYTQVHFSDEERIQVENNYPGYTQHKRYHEEFKIVVRGLRADLEREGPTPELIAQIDMAVGSWLVDHIQTQDMKIGNHIRDVQRWREQMEVLRAANMRQYQAQE
ncbi:MAG: hemerythrin family protein [Synergistaceae bacterium]|jgi:hemerythrin|nr:hemerythrin family protein [Synergistaceae bacterium]